MTSIEWLIEKIEESKNEDGIYCTSFLYNFEIDKAKEMHKQEIIDAYEKGEFDCGCNGTGENYYNKTFKKD